MLRAVEILTAGHWNPAAAVDRVTLSYHDRHRRRIRLTCDGGLEVMLDLSHAVVLNDGDGLLLADERRVLVRAAGEPLLEVRGDAHALLRAAWHIGNRHLAAQLTPEAIRILDDPVIADMLTGLGLSPTRIIAPFTPEGGAYSGRGGHHHGHGHHDHDHHDHHDHNHSHGHSHG